MAHDGRDDIEPSAQWSEEQLKRRRQRNLALAWVLGALVTLFFVVTVVKLGGNVANRPF
jgi:hypothetical protein